MKAKYVCPKINPNKLVLNLFRRLGKGSLSNITIGMVKYFKNHFLREKLNEILKETKYLFRPYISYIKERKKKLQSQYFRPITLK